MSEDWKFRVRINDGPEQPLPTKTTVYAYAAAAVPALFGTNLPTDVEIWVPAMPEHALRFRISENEYGHIVVAHLVRVPDRV